MKKIFLLLIGLFLWFTGSSQSCLPQGITFSTQSQIDSFPTNYPNCTQIEGDVTISGTDITNLNGLSVLTSIGGDLNIVSNPFLISLTGLEKVISIVGWLYIVNNSSLTSLTGLDSLTSIGGNLDIVNTIALTSLTGLEKLTSIGGGLEISDNNALTSLAGLDNLTSIGGNLYIFYNYALTSLTGLKKVNTIGIGIVIQGNSILTSLTGLDNIAAASITGLYILENYSLSTCAVKSVCDYLGNMNGFIEIFNNATGCNSQAEVDTACKTLSVENLILDDVVSIFPNPSSDKITIETSPTPTKSQLSLMNLNGQQLITRQITEPKTQLDISSLPSGVYFVRLTTDRMVEVEKFVKQ